MRKTGYRKLIALLLSGVMFMSNMNIVGATGSDNKADLSYETLQEILDKNKKQQVESMDEDVNFLVELQASPLLQQAADVKTRASIFIASNRGVTAQKKIEAQQNQVKKDLRKVGKFEYLYSYNVVMNGFAMKGKRGDLQKIREMPGVKNVQITNQYKLIEPKDSGYHYSMTSGKMIDSDRVNDLGYTGKNVAVAILDTGLDIEHEAFQKAPEKQRFTKEDISKAVTSNTLKATAEADGLYKSEKIPFAYDYADKDTEVLGPSNHGTHVAGTIAADVKQFKGVAPDSQLFIMKVFPDATAGADEAGILAALEDCVTLGVDDINMSLGSTAGFTNENEITDRVYNNIEKAGINLLCAAGNEGSFSSNTLDGESKLTVDYPDTGLVGSPSTFDSALSIASVNEAEIYNTYFISNGEKINYTEDNAVAETRLSTLNGQTLEYVPVPNYGAVEDFDEVDVLGKVALIERGDLSFAEKEQNAKDAGAAAAIIYNNVDEASLNIQVNGILPIVTISKKDGKKLRNFKEKTITFSEDYHEMLTPEFGGLMSDFSSWGVTNDLALKPEITAPGGDVYSTLPKNLYGNKSGTSMASPHMAGAAAIMRQFLNEQYSDLSLTEKEALVNALMMSTAVPIQNENDIVYSPRQQGSGLANISNAIKTKAYIKVDGSKRPKAELGDSEDGVYSFTFQIVNLSDVELHYSLDAVNLTETITEKNGKKYIAETPRELSDEELSVSFSTESDINVAPKGSTSVTVNLKLNEAGKTALRDFISGTFIDGFVNIVSKDEDGVDLSMPYLGFYGDWDKEKVFDYTSYDEAEPVMSDGYLTIYDYYNQTLLPMGINLFKGFSSKPDKEKNAINYESFASGSVISCKLGMMRGADNVNITIHDENGKELYNRDNPNARKSYYMADYGFAAYFMDYYGYMPTFDGNDNLEEGRLNYKVTATLRDGSAPESMEFPVYFDATKPVLKNVEYKEEDGVPYLYVTVSDNRYVAALQIVDSNDSDTALTQAEFIEEDTANAETTVRYNLTDMQAAGYVEARAVIIDYALNQTITGPFSLTSNEIEPNSITLETTNISLREGSSFQMYATVYPEYAINRSFTWESSDESIVKIDAQTGLFEALKPGQATITARTWNNKTASTTITVVKKIEETRPLPDDFIIKDNGVYQIPANLAANINIKETARNVTLIGAAENTKDKPYKNLSITTEGEQLKLAIRDLHAVVSNVPVLSFATKGNELVLEGVNSVETIKYESKAAIQIDAAVDLTISGNGTLNATSVENSYGAAIGGSAGKDAGSIIINSGKIHAVTYSDAAAIGGGASGASPNITIHGGEVKAEALLSDNPYPMISAGAAIGGGSNAAYAGASQVKVLIDGGKVDATTQRSSAAIGSGSLGAGSSSELKVTIQINGGEVNANSTASNLDSGAAIGSGSGSYKYKPNITVNNGIVNAQTSSQGAAIGTGAGGNAGNLLFNGGVITANSTGAGDAIGKGVAGSAGTVRINGGSVKATASGTGNAISTSSNKIINSDSDEVAKAVLFAPDVTRVSVNGEDWNINANHPDDDQLYVYLPFGTDNLVVMETENGTYRYKVNVSDTGKVDVKRNYQVRSDLINLKATIVNNADEGEDISFVLEADDGYVLPEAIQVTSDGETATYTYDNQSGEVVISAITGDIVITAEGVRNDQTIHEIVYEMDHLQANGPSSVAAGDTLQVTLSSDDGYTLPKQVQVLENGIAKDYTYDAENGLLTVPDVRGSIVIKAQGVRQQFAVTMQLDHINTDAIEYVSYGDDLQFTLQPHTGYVLPDTIMITMGGAEAEFTYDRDSGEVIVKHVTGTIDVQATAVRKTFHVTYQLDHITALINEEVSYGDTLSFTMYTDTDYMLPNSIHVTMDDKNVDVSYNNQTGEVVIANITGDVNIIASAISIKDRNALMQAIEDAQKIDISKYTEESVKIFQDALTDAREVINNPDAITNEYIEALHHLNTAIQGLTEKGQEDTTFVKSILKSTLDKTKALMESKDFNKLAVNVQALIQTRYQQALNVYEKETATISECLEVWENLAEALQYADFMADKTLLAALIKECEKINLDGYAEGVEAFKEALKLANEVMNDKNALQDRINTTYDALLLAKNGLVEKPMEADKTLLKDIMDKVQTAVDHADKYVQNEAWKAFLNAVQYANEIFNNSKATQDEVNDAIMKLSEAYMNIRLQPDEALLSQLKDFLHMYNAIDRALYSRGDLAKLDQTAAKAKALLADENLSKNDVDAFAKEMAQAIAIIQNDKLTTPDNKTNHPTSSSKQPAGNHMSVNSNGVVNTADTTQNAYMMMLLLGSVLTLTQLRKRKQCNK